MVIKSSLSLVLPLYAAMCLGLLNPAIGQTLPSFKVSACKEHRGNLKRCAGEICYEVDIEQAVTAVMGAASAADIRGLFSYHLRLRGATVPKNDVPKYWQELKSKPELKNMPIYDRDSELSRSVSKKIKPVFALFGRDWDVAVIKQDAPFSGAFRQCIYIVSTGLLGLITDEELRSFAAHELAHECFIDELREADRTGSLRAYHLVEFKSDLIAALASLLLKDDPLSLASGIARIEAYYLSADPSVLQENKHPKSQQRRHCVERLLTRIKQGNSAVLRHGPEKRSQAETAASQGNCCVFSRLL